MISSWYHFISWYHNRNSVARHETSGLTRPCHLAKASRLANFKSVFASLPIEHRHRPTPSLVLTCVVLIGLPATGFRSYRVNLRYFYWMDEDEILDMTLDLEVKWHWLWHWHLDTRHCDIRHYIDIDIKKYDKIWYIRCWTMLIRLNWYSWYSTSKLTILSQAECFEHLMSHVCLNE